MNLKSQDEQIDVFVCPNEQSLQESEEANNNTTALPLVQKDDTPTKVKKPDLDISLASTASYVESPPPPQGISHHIGEETTLWSPSRDSFGQQEMEALLQLVPENDSNSVQYYPTLHNDTEGLMDLFDIEL